METSSTSAFAGFALQVICRQEWVREKCLEDPQMLCSSELLLDPAISSTQVTVEVKEPDISRCNRADYFLYSLLPGVVFYSFHLQARKLLHLICYPAGVPSSIGGLIASSDVETVHEAASRILQVTGCI